MSDRMSLHGLLRAKLLVVLATVGLTATVLVVRAPVASAALAAGCARSGTTVTCTYTSGVNQFAVPEYVNVIHVVAVGGTGGNYGYGGDAGASVRGDLYVSPATTLFAVVGGNADELGDGGANGGGGGGASCGGGGGGASDVRTGAYLDTRLIVAGGGGGSGCSGTSPGGAGGAAGAAGVAGSDAFSGTLYAQGGGNGYPGGPTYAGGGAGGTGVTPGVAGSAGLLGVGGYGGAGVAYSCSDSSCGYFGGGGGGGGGLYGGGGGGGGGVSSAAWGGGGGGGGGSSLVPAGGSITTDTTGVPEVVISYTVPAASDYQFSAVANSTLQVAAPGLLANDYLPYPDDIPVLVTDGQHGQATLGADGSFSYVPSPRLTGTDSFTYCLGVYDSDGNYYCDSNTATVTITVTAAPPPQANNDTYLATAGTTLTVPAPGVLGNDANVGNGSALLLTGTAGGPVTLSPDGSFTYTPRPNFDGVDTFTYCIGFAGPSGGCDSNPATVSIGVTGADTTAPAVAITGHPAAASSATSAGIAFTVTDPDNPAPAVTVTCQLDTVAAAACISPVTYTGLSNGTHVFRVTAADPAGNRSAASYTWLVDTIAPTAAITGPTARFTLNTTATVAWRGADNAGGSGIAFYRLRQEQARYNAGFGAWQYPASWQHLASTSVTAPGLVQGSDSCFSVQAVDRAGNASTWSAPSCIASPLDDAALTASAGWTRAIGTAYWNHTITQTKTTAATLTVAGARLDRIALVATTCASCGTVGVYAGTTLIATINLAATATHYRQLIQPPAFAYRTATITIKTLTTGKLVQIDGLGVSRT